MNNNLKILYCDCGTPVKADKNAISVECWRCTMSKVAKTEQTKLVPIGTLYSPNQIVEALSLCKIKEIRIKLYYSLDQMAYQLGISRQTYSKYERLNVPKSQTLSRIRNHINYQMLNYKK